MRGSWPYVVLICSLTVPVAIAFFVECMIGRLLKKSIAEVERWPVNRLTGYFGDVMD